MLRFKKKGRYSALEDTNLYHITAYEVYCFSITEYPKFPFTVMILVPTDKLLQTHLRSQEY